MKHILLILLIICIVLAGIFLPYLPGEYDYFATGLSGILQFAIFASLILIPTGLIWCIMDFSKRKTKEPLKHLIYFRKITLALTVVIILAAALGAFATHNRFSAIIILLSGIYIFIKIRKKGKQLKSLSTTGYSITPFYFIFIPLGVFLFRISFLEKAKDHSTNFVIQQSTQLIQDIEAYKITNGHYPVSIHSTIEDYKPSISGIERFHYELNGNAYNLFFDQFSNMAGTQEIVMYNKLGEHEMTVHNQDLLRIPYENIIHGYHNVAELPNHNWKVFYFD